MTIVALALGWGLDHWRHRESAIRAIRRENLLEYRTQLLKQELERLGVKVTITENRISTLAPNGNAMTYYGDGTVKPVGGSWP